MLAENKDDDPVTFKVFNAFQKEMFERFDGVYKILDKLQKAQDEEKKARDEEKKARDEEKKARDEEKRAREDEKKKREEAQEEIWKELGEYNLLGAIKKAVCLHYGTFITLVHIYYIYFVHMLILFPHITVNTDTMHHSKID